MYTALVNYFIGILEQKKPMSSDEREEYRYGLEMGFAMIAYAISTIIIGFIFGMPFESGISLIVLFSLKQYVGGFHAETHLKCYFFSLAIVAAILLLSKMSLAAGLTLAVIIAGLAGAALIGWLAPVNNNNKPIDEVEAVVYRKRALIILGIIIVATGVLLLLRMYFIAFTICLTLLSIGISALCGKIKYKCGR